MAEDGAENVVMIDPRAPKAWQKRCSVNDKKALRCNLDNALIALRYDHDIRDVYAYDQMLRVPVVMHEIGSIETCHRWVSDVDVVNLQSWMQRNGFPSMGLETVRSAIMAHADRNAFHPVRDYLRSLVWDGVQRIGVWLPRYLGAPFNHYTQHIGRMFMVQMIARIIDPGCQADHMLVLEGAQGILKSSACRILGGAWFSDHLPEITNGREASQHLRGKWVIEVAEMHAMGKAEATQLKSFITRTTEQYRPFWGRAEVQEPRQCVFVGTTNQDAYLRDPTGGRRFWPVPTGVDAAIDVDRLAEDRDQLFAEACVAYDRGDQYWPDRAFEAELIGPEQQARFEGDIWEDKILGYVQARSRVTVSEVAREALFIETAHMTPAQGLRISGVLKEHGWVSKRDMRKRYWVRD